MSSATIWDARGWWEKAEIPRDEEQKFTFDRYAWDLWIIISGREYSSHQQSPKHGRFKHKDDLYKIVLIYVYLQVILSRLGDRI